MKKEHLSYLERLTEYYKMPFETLFNTYVEKQRQYVNRDLCLKKGVDLFHAYEQGDRALRVIDTYLAKQERKQ